MTLLWRLCLGLVLIVPALAEAAVLENPSNGLSYSGIGVVSGWKCTANGPLTVRFNGGAPLPLAYGNERADVRDAGACPSARVGFVSLMNWANLGDGVYTAVAYDNGIEFARSTFMVATTGESFVRGAEGECRVPDFPAPGESMRFAWNEATQHLEMVGDRTGFVPGTGSGSGSGATLENPSNGLSYSGIGVVSGWKCMANGLLTVRFNGGAPLPLAYGNERADVRDAGACPNARVGFVSLMNWANLGDGIHTAVAYDNGVEFARSTFAVATTGEAFVREAGGECRVPDFPVPGESMRFAWNEATQHLEMVGGSSGGTGELAEPYSEATMARLGSDIRGTLGQTDDVHYYRLDISRSGTVTVDTTGNTDTVGRLQTGPDATGPDGSLVGEDDRAGSGNNFRISQPLPAGTYYLLVSGRTTGDYTLRIRFTPDPTCTSDNHGDTPDSATPIGFDQTVRGSLECEEDNDYFRVNVPRTGILDVKTWDHERGITASWGNDICHNGHVCLPDGWTTDENDGTHATAEVAAGTYYIRVESELHQATGPYQLNVRLHPLQDDHGDFDTEATDVSVPSVTRGIIETIDPHDTQHGNYSTDVDVFEVTLPERPPEAYSDFTWERQTTITVEGETLVQAQLRDTVGSEWEEAQTPQSNNTIEFTYTQTSSTVGDKLWLEVAGADHTVHNTGPYTVRVSVEGTRGGDGGTGEIELICLLKLTFTSDQPPPGQAPTIELWACGKTDSWDPTCEDVLAYYASWNVPLFEARGYDTQEEEVVRRYPQTEAGNLQCHSDRTGR